MKLTHKRLLDVLRYDQNTGHLWWNQVRKKSLKDKPAGADQHGYVRLIVDGEKLYAHRLAWFYVHGEWPEHEIDHINRVRNDNRIKNLRCVTRMQNGCNMPRPRDNTSGFIGVSWAKRERLFEAYITVNRRRMNLGYFKRAAEAYRARQAAEDKYFGALRTRL